VPPPPAPDIREERGAKGGNKKDEGDDVHGLLADVPAGEGIDEKLGVGGRQVADAHLRPHRPVPVGARTVAVTVPDAQDEPGKGGKKDHHEVRQPGLPPGPPEENEEDYRRVKHEEKFIEKSEHGAVSGIFSPLDSPAAFVADEASVLSGADSRVKEVDDAAPGPLAQGHHREKPVVIGPGKVLADEFAEGG